jgi:hypothetical protein
MKTMAVLVVTALVGLQKADSPTNNQTNPKYHAESSAYVIRGKDGPTYVTENRSFRFAEVLGDKGEYEAILLLEETFKNERTEGIEGVRGTGTVKAWTLGPNQERNRRWTFQATANEGEVRDRFFRVTAWGCCDAPTVHTYYNMLTGHKLYVSNSDILEVTGEGEGPMASRYVAFGYGPIGRLSEPPQLQYGTDRTIAQRFSILSSREYYDPPEVFISTDRALEKSLDLRGSPMNFTIVLKYRNNVELRIPVEADAIHPEKAVLPKGYVLRPEKGG